GTFEILARLEHRFLAHHARAAHLLQAALRVGNAPMAGFELDGLAAEIGERDGIGPEEIAVLGRGTLGQEARGRRDLDLAGHGTIRCLGGIHRRPLVPKPGFSSLILSTLSILSTLVNSLVPSLHPVAMTRLPSPAKDHYNLASFITARKIAWNACPHRTRSAARFLSRDRAMADLPRPYPFEPGRLGHHPQLRLQRRD